MKFKNFFLGIRTKTALIFFAVFILIVLPVNYIIYSKVKTVLIAADDKELSAEGEKLLSRVRLDPALVPIPSKGYSVFLSVINGPQMDTLFVSPDFPELAAYDFSQIAESSLFELDTFRILVLRRPVEFSQSNLIFSLARSKNALTANITDLRLNLILANLISILIAGILVYFAAGYTLRPMKKIIEAAQKINASKSIDRVPVPATHDENRQLAININDMLARIENSIKNQTNFFASAAHELRTPLAVMKTELTLVSKENRWHGLLKEVERLERTVSDFLMISQLKSESLSVRRKSVDIDDLLFSSLKKVKYLSDDLKKKIQVNIQSEENGPLYVDEDKLEIVIVNLVENALNYSPADSIIQVKVSCQPGLRIEIANPLLENIQNVDSLKNDFVKSELSPGLGMGLWIANEIVKLHGGKLNLESRDLNFIAIIDIPS